MPISSSLAAFAVKNNQQTNAMGQAKERGTFDERKAQSLARKEVQRKQFAQIVENVEKRVEGSKKPYPKGMMPVGMLAALALTMGMGGPKR